MLTVTKRAAALLKAAKAAEGAAEETGISISRTPARDDSGMLAVGFAISDRPGPDYEEFEQQGLRIFVENALVEPLDGRTLDVRDGSQGLQLVFL